MFQTFNAKKAKYAAAVSSKVQPPGRSRLNEQKDELQEFMMEEESPFDMAPEFSKQFSKNSTKTVKTNNFMFDHIVEDCQDLSQYIDKIDKYMMDKIY